MSSSLVHPHDCLASCWASRTHRLVQQDSSPVLMHDTEKLLHSVPIGKVAPHSSLMCTIAMQMSWAKWLWGLQNVKCGKCQFSLPLVRRQGTVHSSMVDHVFLMPKVSGLSYRSQVFTAPVRLWGALEPFLLPHGALSGTTAASAEGWSAQLGGPSGGSVDPQAVFDPSTVAVEPGRLGPARVLQNYFPSRKAMASQNKENIYYGVGKQGLTRNSVLNYQMSSMRTREGSWMEQISLPSSPPALCLADQLKSASKGGTITSWWQGRGILHMLRHILLSDNSAWVYPDVNSSQGVSVSPEQIVSCGQKKNGWRLNRSCAESCVGSCLAWDTGCSPWNLPHTFMCGNRLRAGSRFLGALGQSLCTEVPMDLKQWHQNQSMVLGWRMVLSIQKDALVLTLSVGNGKLSIW